MSAISHFIFAFNITSCTSYHDRLDKWREKALHRRTRQYPYYV